MVEHRAGNTIAMRLLAHQVVQQAEDLESTPEPETAQLLTDLQIPAQ